MTVDGSARLTTAQQDKYDRLEHMFVEGDLPTRLLAVFLILARAVLIGVVAGALFVGLVISTFVIAQAL